MYCVYLLQSTVNKSLYIGCSSDLEKRILAYNQSQSYHTKKYSPWQLIYLEAFISKQDVYGREKALKLHKQGLRRLKERLRNSLKV